MNLYFLIANICRSSIVKLCQILHIPFPGHKFLNSDRPSLNAVCGTEQYSLSIGFIENFMSDRYIKREIPI
jgi:hypothetical protein